jgi:hypothetical protein
LTSLKEPIPKFIKKRESSNSKERSGKCTFINSVKIRESRTDIALSPDTFQIPTEENEILDTEGAQVVDYLKK